MKKSNSILKENNSSQPIKTSDQNFIIDNTKRGEILNSLIMGTTAVEIAENLRISLPQLYKILNQDAKFKEEFSKAQEIGMRTLVEKMLILYDNKPDKLDNADLFFLKERSAFLRWLAPKVSSFFVEKQHIKTDNDTKISISFESGFDKGETIELSPDDFEFTPPDSEVNPQGKTD